MSCARYLRKNATAYEKILWRKLRNRRFAEYKFRRQHPLGSYILDFYCIEARLAIELDGSGHGYKLREKRDRERDAYCQSQDIRMLRFWNSAVRENLDGVMEAIWMALEEHRGQHGVAREPSP